MRATSPSALSQAACAYPTTSAAVAGRREATVVAVESSTAMGEVPIELARPGIDRAGLQMALLDARDGLHLAVIADREQLVGVQHFVVADGTLLRFDAGAVQQLQYAPPRDPGEEGAVRRRRD